MAVTSTTRFALPQWSAGSDPPVTRAQMNALLASIEAKAAGYLEDTAANRPAAGAANKGFLFRATDTGALSVSTGSTWVTVPSGATFLATAGGQMSGALDMNGQELQNAVVINAKAKRSTITHSSNGTLTLDANNAASFTVTLQANVTGITVNNLDDGESIKVTFVEDATGGRTVAFPSWIWPAGGTVATAGFKTTANAKNVLYLEKEGSDIQAYLASDLKT